MTDWPILCVVATFLSALAIYCWYAGRHRDVNWWFSVQTICIALWITGIAGTHSGHLPEFWGRWTFASASLMPAACLGFARVFPEVSTWPPRWLVRSVHVIGFAFVLVAVSTPWIAFDFVITPAGTLKRKAGPLFPFFSAYFLLCVAAIVGTLSTKWRHSRGVARAQLRYYNVGFLVLVCGAVTTNLLIPALTGHSEYSTVGPFFVLPFVALVAHSIVRHRLLDLNLVVGRSVAFIMAILVASAGILGIMVYLRVARLSDTVSLPLPLAVALLVTAALLSGPVIPRVARLIDSYLLRGRPDLDQVLKETSRRLSRLPTEEQISAELTQALTSAFAPELLIVSVQKPRRAEPEDRSLEELAWAVSGPTPSVRLLRVRPYQEQREAALISLGAEVWIALGRAGQRTGIVVLGARRDGEAYLAPSLNFLEDLAELASLALDVAYLLGQQMLFESERHRLAYLARMGRAYAGLGHEIRTPLTTISNFISALPDRIDDPEFRDTMVRLIPAEVTRIVQLAERLRQMAPSNDGALAPVNLTVLLNDLLAVHDLSMKGRGVHVTFKCEPGLPVVMGDQQQLTQLFVNLLTNALEATPPQGIVTIEAITRRSTDALTVIVRILDTGPGIDPTLQSRIFQPFFTTKASGTGLGLSICREIADFHRAKLIVDSRSDTAGTVAEVEFAAYSPDGTDDLSSGIVPRLISTNQ